MRRVLAVLAVMALFGAACGDDDDEAATGTTDTTEATTSGADQAAVATYCKDSLAIETVGEPDIDFENASEEEQKEAVKKYVAEDIEPLVERLKASVPAEIDAPAQVLFGAIDKIAADGDFEKHIETPEVQAAEAEVHAYDLANCGWEKTDVTAVDYAFQGIPATLDPGVTSFELRNDGKELHELIVVKKKDGVTESFEEILKLEEEGRQKVEEVATGFAAPGEDDYAVAELGAGEYLVVCFIPVGATGQGPPPEDAPPHVARGMKAEFKVA